MVLAIFAVLAAVAIPLLSRSTPEHRLREAATELVANLRLARSMVVSGQMLGTTGPIDAVDVTFDDSSDSYSVIAWNLASGTMSTVKTIRMSDYRGATIDLVPTIAPTPTVRFTRNGSADRIATITLSDPAVGLPKRVEITRAGLSRLE